MKSKDIIVIFLFAICQLLPASVSKQAKDQGKPMQSSLTDIDLASIALETGDLPPAYSGEIATMRLPKGFKKQPKAKMAIDQRIKNKEEVVGGVTIFLYETKEEVDRGYSALIKGFGKPGRDTLTRSTNWVPPNIGEKATISKFEVILELAGHYFKTFTFVFIRCNAVVQISLDESEILLTYAQKLDHRIVSSAICR